MTKVKHVCTSLLVSVLVLQMKSLSIFSHRTHSYLTPLPTCLPPVMLWHHSRYLADAFLSPTAKESVGNSPRTAVHLMCHWVSVYPAHAQLKISRFHSSSSRWWRERRARRKNKNIFQMCALFCAHKERVYLKLFMRVTAIPIIMFLLLCNVALMIKLEVKQLNKITVICCMLCDFLLCVYVFVSVLVCVLWSRSLRGPVLTEHSQDRHIRAAYRQMAVSDDALALAS